MKSRLLIAIALIVSQLFVLGLSAQPAPTPSTWGDNTQVVPPVGMTFVEGDILMPLGADMTRATYEAKLWPNGVAYYEFATDISATNKALMRAAMDELELTAGVTFVPRNGQANYIYIHDDDGNSSAVGMQGGRQTLSIVSWSYRYIVIHELMHALGVWHEQSRTDREQYITINYNNIQDGYRGNFNVAATSRTVGGYDFCSVMHYGALYFSKNGQPTISAKPGYEAYQSCMGNQTYLTEQDKAGLLAMYPNNRLSNGGFENGMTAWKFLPNATNCMSSVGSGSIEGVAYLAVNSRAAACGSLAQDVTRAVAAGESYTFSVKARVPSGTRGARLVVTARGGTAEVVSQPVVLDAMWRCYAVTLPVANGGHTGVRVEFALDVFSGLQDYNIDDARLTVGAHSPCAPLSDRSMAANGDFAAGLDGFKASNAAAFTAQGGAVAARPLSNMAATLAQNTGYNVAANTSLEMRVDLGSRAAAGQTVLVTARNLASADGAITCTFTVPAGAVSNVYIVRGKANAFWHQLRVELTLPAGASSGDISIDNVDVRTSATPVTATQCVTPELPGNKPQTAVSITSESYSAQMPVGSYTVAGGEPVPTCSAGGLPVTHTVWYTLTPTQDRLLDIFATGYDSVLAVYTGQPGSLTQVACVDNADSIGTEWLSIPVRANIPYYIVAGSWNGSVGTLGLKVATVRNLIADAGFDWDNSLWKQISVPAVRVDDIRTCGLTGTHGSNCALRFKGGADEASVYKQVIRPEAVAGGWNVAAGSDLWLGYAVSSTSKKCKISLKATVTFANGTKQKIAAPQVIGSTGGEYVFQTATAQLQRADVTKIVVKIKNKSKGGVALVDNVVFATGTALSEYELLRGGGVQGRKTAPTAVQPRGEGAPAEIIGVLPPPAAPEGFRGQN